MMNAIKLWARSNEFLATCVSSLRVFLLLFFPLSSPSFGALVYIAWRSCLLHTKEKDIQIRIYLTS